MDLEIDFLAIGEETRSGDAIVLRYGNLQGDRDEYRVVVIDAGFEEGGNKVVEQIKNIYNTETIDLLVSTHPDNDHSGGIVNILEQLKVKKIWMHCPWKHTENISKLFNHPAVTDNSVENRIEKGLSIAKDIESKAEELGIPIEEPFSGLMDDTKKLLVLGPSESYYLKELLPNFRCTPEPKSFIKIMSEGIENLSESIKNYFEERWDLETLDNGGTTTAENNSSVILLLMVDDNYHVLFTADAGQPAIQKVVDLFDSAEYDYSKIKFIQVPHHGSHRNINPDILDKLIGPKLSNEPLISIKTAVVSVAKKDDGKHPSKRATNAFRRRGVPVHQTRGGLIYHSTGNAPRKNMYATATPIPFFHGEIEEDND